MDADFEESKSESEEVEREIENSNEVDEDKTANTLETPEPPYHIVCGNRYRNNQKKYDQQFVLEMHLLQELQPTAMDALRFHRHFARTTIWPLLHTRREIEHFVRSSYKLPPKDQSRLNYLLKEKQH